MTGVSDVHEQVLVGRWRHRFDGRWRVPCGVAHGLVVTGKGGWERGGTEHLFVVVVALAMIVSRLF